MDHRLLSFVRPARGTRSDAGLLAVRSDHGAFAELVAGTAGGLGVCRNLLSEADAEDAFQATFLGLLRFPFDATALASWSTVRPAVYSRPEGKPHAPGVRERASAAQRLRCSNTTNGQTRGDRTRKWNDCRRSTDRHSSACSKG